MHTTAAGIFWLTGLSGSGKTTLSLAVARQLTALGKSCFVLDGDLLRQGLCADLDYSPEGRGENIRRAGEVARLVALQGHICLCAFITPYEALRQRLRLRLGPLYHEVYLQCPIETCMERDPKHNYRKARQGTMPGYTGLDAPFEPPQAPDLRVPTNLLAIDDCVRVLCEYILSTQAPQQGE